MIIQKRKVKPIQKKPRKKPLPSSSSSKVKLEILRESMEEENEIDISQFSIPKMTDDPELQARMKQLNKFN